MPKRIVYQDANGQVYVVIPAPNCPLTVEQIAEKDIPKGMKYQIVEASDLPGDRSFRNAWALKGHKEIVIDMPRARDIHRNCLRAIRKPILEKLDVDFIRAVEAGDAEKQKAIGAKKQALRDVPADPAIEAAATPDDLKAVLPAVLKENP